MTLLSSVAETYHFEAGPSFGKNFDAALKQTDLQYSHGINKK
jgi:hypothetical protein